MVKVFVYGTLMYPEVLDALEIRLADSQPPKSATLYDFCRETVRLTPEGNFPGIVAATGEEVVGLLLTLKEDADLDILDEFEGVSEGYYRRQAVSVDVTGESFTTAFAYVCAHRLVPYLDGPWCPDRFRSQDLAEYVRRMRLH